MSSENSVELLLRMGGYSKKNLKAWYTRLGKPYLTMDFNEAILHQNYEIYRTGNYLSRF